MSQSLHQYLSQFVTEERQALFQHNMQFRTRWLTVVLEDIFQPQNASAVLRSCDCFGVQDVHIIENQYEYKLNPDVTVGSSQWLNLHHYNNTSDNTTSCLEQLKKKGYRLIATTPHEKDVTIRELPLNEPVALLFGTERLGLSDRALNMADGYTCIPMYGFTHSYNISVAVALTLYELVTRLHASGLPWQLTKKEQEEILMAWTRSSVKRADLLEREFYAKNK